jgi:pyrroloquinoline quinone biosynthesis protein A
LDRVPLTARPTQETAMTWTTPAYQDLRFGFEITMYISAR